MLEVRVPASTSNLGPGFDCLGLALSLFLTCRVDAHPRAGAHGLERGAGCEAWPADGANLLLRAFGAGAEHFGVEPGGRTFRVRSEIPVGRGLGSSGSAVIAGLALAAELSPREVDDGELLRLAVAIEAHPDNTAPALLGGCTLTVPIEGRAPVVVRQALHESLAFAVAWPDAPLDTLSARRLLPERVPFADAIENPRRLALLLEGLRSGDPELLRLGAADRLHVPYRSPRIVGAEPALAAALGSGAHLATISGSGSGLVAIAAPERISAVAEAMTAAFHASGAGGQARVVQAVQTRTFARRLDP
jgi:homoserine kinase